MKLLSTAVVLVLAAACTKEPSHLDLTACAAHPISSGVSSGSTDPGDRLARIERRLDKVITFLDQNLPPAEPYIQSREIVPEIPERSGIEVCQRD